MVSDGLDFVAGGSALVAVVASGISLTDPHASLMPYVAGAAAAINLGASLLGLWVWGATPNQASDGGDTGTRERILIEDIGTTSVGVGFVTMSSAPIARNWVEPRVLIGVGLSILFAAGVVMLLAMAIIIKKQQLVQEGYKVPDDPTEVLSPGDDSDDS